MLRFVTGAAIGAIATASMSVSARAEASAQERAAQKKPVEGHDAAAAVVKDRSAGGTQRTKTTASESDGAKVTDDGTASDIVVVGVRGSIESATEKKRKAQQVVDSVVSEDAGKLPDNNVVEALSRISGVNITRSQGQGSGITIRGLAGVQTTVNGRDVAVGQNRGISLSDIPAELIKSVDVYKSRGANQPEGGIGGTVNVELRRPLELKKGLLVVGSARGQYNDITASVNPFLSLLASYRTDTGMGEMGLLINGSFTRTDYAEPLVESETPFGFRNFAQGTLPAEVRNSAIAPYKIRFGENSGRREQPAFTTTYQWRPSESLNFTLEGQYFGSRTRDRYAGASLNTREDGVALSNVVVGKSGAIQSATYTQAIRDGQGNLLFGVPIFVFSTDSRSRSDTLIGNFEAHWQSGIANIDFNAQHQRFVREVFGIVASQRYSQATAANVNFNNPLVKGGIPTFDIPGVDLTDAAAGRIDRIGDNRRRNTTASLVMAIDTTLRLSDTAFLRAFQFGPRYTFRRDKTFYGYRDLVFDNLPRPGITALGLPNRLFAPKLNGQTPFSARVIDSAYLLDNIDTLRPQLLGLNPSGRNGNGPDGSLADFFGTPSPTFDPLQGGVFRERTMAFYGQASWALDLGFPVEGLAGVRYVNVFGGVEGVRLVRDPPRPDGGCCTSTIISDNVRANSADVLPSMSAVFHFDPKLQLRTAYNLNVQRPNFGSLRDTYVYDGSAASNPNADVQAGNPNLKPVRDHNFNASLEWFPRAGASLTAGAFYKKQQGFIYNTLAFEAVPPLGGAIRRVFRERNAGSGEILGFEFTGNMPFFFMPEFLSPFGITANATYIPLAKLAVPDVTQTKFSDVRFPSTSELSYNIILYYETGKLSGRVAYNWRSQFYTFFDAVTPGNVQTGRPQQRLDAALNYTPVPFITLSLEGSNLMRSLDRYRYDLYPDLPVGLRSQARTIQASTRFRF